MIIIINKQIHCIRKLIAHDSIMQDDHDAVMEAIRHVAKTGERVVIAGVAIIPAADLPAIKRAADDRAVSERMLAETIQFLCKLK